MNFDIKKDTVIELIKKIITTDVIKCEYLLSNIKLDNVTVKHSNMKTKLKKVGGDIFILDYGQEVGPYNIKYIPNNSLTIKINNDISISIYKTIDKYVDVIDYVVYTVKFFGIPFKIKYQIITSTPNFSYEMSINNNDHFNYTITKNEYNTIIDYYLTFKETYDNNLKTNQENTLLAKIKTDLINVLTTNKIEIKLN